MREIPSITSSSYLSNVVDMQAVGGVGLVAPAQHQYGNAGGHQAIFDMLNRQQAMPTTVTTPPEKKPMATQTRLVQVFIADANENIPLDKRLIYSGEQKITDLTDQELFFDVDIKSLLDKHNDVRKATVDKAVKERTEYLEPARIRDLKMTVVTIAQF